jgi:hypothetical protein
MPLAAWDGAVRTAAKAAGVLRVAQALKARAMRNAPRSRSARVLGISNAATRPARADACACRGGAPQGVAPFAFGFRNAGQGWRELTTVAPCGAPHPSPVARAIPPPECGKHAGRPRAVTTTGAMPHTHKQTARRRAMRGRWHIRLSSPPSGLVCGEPDDRRKRMPGTPPRGARPARTYTAHWTPAFAGMWSLAPNHETVSTGRCVREHMRTPPQLASHTRQERRQ